MDISDFTVTDMVQIGHLLPYKGLIAEATVEEEG
jgi:hypothetical protein